MIKRTPKPKNTDDPLVNRGWVARPTHQSHRVQRDGRGFKSFAAPMKIEALVTVCTEKLFHELREWLPSARVSFPDTPLYVATDVPKERVLEEAEKLCVENVVVLPFDLSYAEGRVDKVNVWAEHWVREAIWGKLDCLRRVVKRVNGGVLLADCDISFAAPPYRDCFYADVVMSPNFTGDLQKMTRTLDRQGKIPLYVRDSLFNAGMLLTRSVEFCEWWLKAYEEGGPNTFVEQTAMEQVPRLFDVDYFGPEENFGKWRFAAPPPNTNSFHMHLHEPARKQEVTALKIAAQSAAARARAFLREYPNKRR